MLGHVGLKDELIKRGLKHSGKTAELAERLADALTEEKKAQTA